MLLVQNPFADATFAIVVTGPELRVISTLLVDKIEVAPDVELDASFKREFKAADAPVDLGLLARIESIYVDELRRQSQ